MIHPRVVSILLLVGSFAPIARSAETAEARTAITGATMTPVVRMCGKFSAAISGAAGFQIFKRRPHQRQGARCAEGRADHGRRRIKWHEGKMMVGA